MKITLDEATLSKAVINHLRSIGVQSDILRVDFRYTRVPYTVFAEVELAEAALAKPTRVRIPVELAVADAAEEVAPTPPPAEPLVDPDSLPPETSDEPEAPRPETPAAPLFGGGG